MLYPREFADYHMHAYAPFETGMKCFDRLASLNVTDANLLAYTYIETGIDNNLICLNYKEKCRSVRLRVFGGLYYDPDLNNAVMPYREQAELLLAMGCDGIKFLDMKPNYNLYCGCSMDDTVYDEMYDFLEEKGIPLVTHIADPETFWNRALMKPEEIACGWCFDDDKFLTQQQIFDCTRRRLARNPKLKMCLAHLGFMSRRLELCHEIFETYPNVSFDLAPGWSLFNDFMRDAEGWRNFFIKYSERILYGTDTSTGISYEHMAALQRTMIETVSQDSTARPIPHFPKEMMCGLNLPEKAQRDICHDNFFRHVGTDIKAVDHALFGEHEKLIRSVAGKQGNADILNHLEEMRHTL